MTPCGPSLLRESLPRLARFVPRSFPRKALFQRNKNPLEVDGCCFILGQN